MILKIVFKLSLNVQLMIFKSASAKSNIEVSDSLFSNKHALNVRVTLNGKSLKFSDAYKIEPVFERHPINSEFSTSKHDLSANTKTPPLSDDEQFLKI